MKDDIESLKIDRFVSKTFSAIAFINTSLVIIDTGLNISNIPDEFMSDRYVLIFGSAIAFSLMNYKYNKANSMIKKLSK